MQPFMTFTCLRISCASMVLRVRTSVVDVPVEDFPRDILHGWFVVIDQM